MHFYGKAEESNLVIFRAEELSCVNPNLLRWGCDYRQVLVRVVLQPTDVLNPVKYVTHQKLA